MKVKVFCHTCDGAGIIKETAYPSGEIIEVVCPECNGKKWVWAEKEA
jgi:DnaJ-class molecular chaperone